MNWNPDFDRQHCCFKILSREATYFRQNTAWPSLEEYNEKLNTRLEKVVNANGLPLHCVSDNPKPTTFSEGYEPRLYLRGELSTRPENWHDFFNYLVWMRFPLSKAAINAMQYADLHDRYQTNKKYRSSRENALTLFDENGIFVLSKSQKWIDLLKQHRWSEVFCKHREAICEDMQFLVVGHAIYEKMLAPYIGLTAKAVYVVVDNFRIDEDLLLSEYLKQINTTEGLSPLPLLGIPGWWHENNMPEFYENKDYFR